MKKLLLLSALTFVFVNVLFSQNLPSYVPKNGLVGYWPFEGNTNDVSGNGNKGSLSGATLTTDRNGITNSAVNFASTGQHIDFLSTDTWCSASHTISFWFNTAFIAGKDQFILAKRSTCLGGNENFFQVSISPNSNQLDIGWYNNAGASFSKPFTSNIWNHVVYSVNGSNGFLWLNGVLVGSSSNYIPKVNTAILRAGNHSCNVSNDDYIGKFDDLGLWNRGLSQQEVTALYNGGNQSALSSTKVYVDAQVTLKQNDTLQLSISTEKLNTIDNVIAYQTDFSYDTTRYTYLSNNLVGTLNSTGNVVVNSTKNGKLSISYMSQTALNGVGSLLKLKFKSNNTLGQGIFGLSNFLYNTTAITSLKSDTVTTIDGIPPIAKITYSATPVRKGDSLLITVNFSEKMAVLPNPQINLTGQNTLQNSNLTKVNDTTYTYWWVVEKGNGSVNVNLATGKDLAGNGIVAKPTQNPSFTVLPTLFGDIDTNKSVQAYDAALALQYSVGLNPLPTIDPLPWSNWRLAVANVDTIGNVTANDAALILQYSAKLITTFPADAKKRGGDAPTADVTVSKVGNQLVFRTTGILYGFNVYFKDNFNAFGQPEVSDKNAIVATNINTTTYNVGLASTTPFTVNEPFLTIPIIANRQVQGTVDIVANTQEKSLSYGAAAGMLDLSKEMLIVYPNPTKDVITIKNAQGNKLRIIDVEGKELFLSKQINSIQFDLNMKSFTSSGIYIFQILDEKGAMIESKKVILE